MLGRKCISPYYSERANFARMKRCTMNLAINVLCALILFLLWGCKTDHAGIPGRSYSGTLLGMKYEIDTPGDTIDRSDIIDSVFRSFELIFNSSSAHSLINEINNFKRTDTVFVVTDSTRLFGIVYDMASDLSRNTQRGWDPALAPLRRNLLMNGSSAHVTDTLLEACAFNDFNIRMQEHFDERGSYLKTSLLKRNLLIELDFTDIASALAVDYLAEAFVIHGVKSFRITHADDMLCQGLSGNELATVQLGIGTGGENPKVDVGNIAFARRDIEHKKSLIDPSTGYYSEGPVIYTAVVSPKLTEARIFCQAFIIQDLSSIADYYNQNPETNVHSFIFFQQGDTIQNASTSGFDQRIVLNKPTE